MENYDIALFVFDLIYICFLIWLSDHKSMRLFKQLHLLYCVPLLMTVIHISFTNAEICLLGLYIASALAFIGFFVEKTRVKRHLSIFGMFSTMITLPFCMLVQDYRNPHYTEEFVEGCRTMKEYYVLSEYKEIDWEGLEKKYTELFQQADREKDKELAFEYWMQFTKEFQDAHVSVEAVKDNEEMNEEYAKKCAGYDYGFSLVTLEDGRTVFANVDEKSSAYQSGIRNGMELTAIDGNEIEDALKSANTWFCVFPDKENELFYKCLSVTADCDKEIKVDYIDNNGNKQTVNCSECGNGYERFRDTYRKLRWYKEETNFSCEMVTENIGRIVINDMMVPPGIQYGEEVVDEEEEKYNGLKARVRDQIEELKNDGADKLIIDLRNNHGGYMDVSIALAEMFNDKERFGAAEGRYNEKKDKYEIVDSVSLKADNVWGDGEIVILVNSETASAAELFTYLMSGLDNVTVMGMTKTIGSAMMVGGYQLVRFGINYPEMLILDENADVLIDSDVNRINKLPLDVRIPFNEEAFGAIMEDGRDYVREQAVDYLDNDIK